MLTGSEDNLIREPQFKSRQRDARASVRICLLEDDTQFAELVRAQLRRMSWVESRLEVAGTLAEALEKLARESFDLVVTDLNLPDSAGVQTVEALSRAGEHPIIVLTGDTTAGLYVSAMQAGAYDVLAKDGLSAAALERLVRLAAIQAHTHGLLRDSERRFDRLLALSTGWYWEQDAQFRYTRFEGRIDELLASDSRPLLGKRRWEVPTNEPVTGTWDDHRVLLEGHLPFRNFETRRLGDDGKVHYVSASGEPIFDAEGGFRGYCGFATDITDRQRAETALRESEQHFRSTFELAGSGIAHVGLDGRLLRVNRSLSRILGYPEGELVGRLVKELSHPEDRDVTDAPRRSVHSGEADSIRLEKRYLRSDGRTIWVELTVAPVRDAGGKALYDIAVMDDITERKSAEAALRASEERFRSLTELSADLYWETDAQHRIVRTTHGAKHGAINARGGQIGKTRWEVPATQPDAAGWAAHRAILDAHLPFRDFELARLDAEGVERHLSISGEPVFDGSGAFAGYRGVGKEITARKREEKLLKLEHDIALFLGEADSVAAGLQAVIRYFCESEGWWGGRYWRAEEQGEVLRFGEGWGRPGSAVEQYNEQARDVVYRAGEGYVGRVWQSGEPAWISDIQKDGRAARKYLAPGVLKRSTFLFPVSGAGKAIGVMAFDSGEVREPDKRLLEAVRVIGVQVGQFVQRKQAEEVLRESEARFHSLTDLSSDFYWETDAEHRIVPTHYDLEHRPVVRSSQRFGKTRWELAATYPDDAGWAAHRATMEAHLPFRDFEFGRMDDGVERHLSISGEPVFDPAGRFKGYRGIGRDISARKREERLLDLEHTVTRCLSEADSVSSAVQQAMRAVCETLKWEIGRYFVLDEGAGVLRFQEAWVLPGFELERFIQEWRDVTYAPGIGLVGLAWQSGEPQWAADLTTDPRASRRSVATGAGMRGAFVLPVASSGKVTGVFSFNSRAVREPDARLLSAAEALVGQFSQFVQRKQVEEMLRESAATFRAIFEQAAVGIAIRSLDGRWLQVNQKLCDILGYSREELMSTTSVELTPPDERGMAVDHNERIARGEISTYSREKRYLQKDGRSVWVNLTVQVVKGSDGRPNHLISVIEDISERKRDQRLLSLEHLVTRSLSEAGGEAVALREVIRAVCETQDWECGRYFGWEEAAGVLTLKESWHVPSAALEAVIAESRSLAYQPGSGLIGGAFRSAQPLWVSDLAKDPRVKSGLARRAGMHGAFLFAAISEGKPVGVFAFHSREVREPDGRLLQAAQVIGSQVGQFLLRTRAEQRQAAHVRYQRKIAQFGRSALGKREPAELIEEAVQIVLEGLRPDAVAYLEPGGAEREVVLRAVAGLPEAPAAMIARYDPGGSLAAVLERGEAAVVDEAPENPPLPYAWASGSSSAALVPLHADKRVRGALCVVSRRRAAFGDEETKFVDAVASVLSTGLGRIDSEGRLAYLAQFDPLTGLPNRTLLADRFSQMIVQAKRRDSPLAVLFIDLDEFKMVNDTLGHAGGDALLKEVAVRLQSTVRTGDTVARISGDEFAIVLADLARAEDAALVAQKVIDRLAATVEIHGKEVFVTASVGIAAFPADGADAEALLGAADAAMYRAKQSGRNAYQFFTAEINRRSRARAEMGSELRRALEREEFALDYQPKYRLSDRRPCGAEALLRWKHPQRGTVSPAEFIPVLEETGLIVPVGEWVVRRTCEDLKAWRAAGVNLGPVSVNLSARQFRLPDLDARIKALVASAGVEPRLIELEITESQLMQDPDQAIRVMRALCDAGMRIAIDDFGTGYSSLAYLTRFPVDSLKIDRSFVKDMTADKDDATIVRTIIEMAHSLGFTVVAEGVETEEQAAFLRLLRCQEAQGYLFARPMPAAELGALVGS